MLKLFLKTNSIKKETFNFREKSVIYKFKSYLSLLQKNYLNYTYNTKKNFEKQCNIKCEMHFEY